MKEGGAVENQRGEQEGEQEEAKQTFLKSSRVEEGERGGDTRPSRCCGSAGSDEKKRAREIQMTCCRLRGVCAGARRIV
eukprot:142598-Hanusia_phi.AAC.2